MKPIRVIILSIVGVLWLAAAGLAAPTLELYGTMHAMGVIVQLDASDDPNQDAVANVTYRPSGGAYRAGFGLSRVSDTRFVGSLFWLQAGVTYDVRVSFTDPDADPLDGVALTASAATRPEPNLPAAKRSLFVTPSGAGTACTELTPCALDYALSQVLEGEEVVLRGGVYTVGEMSLPRSGASGAPIVIRGYPGEEAVLDGADPASFTWTQVGGGVYSATVNVEDTHLVLANGDRLYPYQSLADLQNLYWGLPGFYADGDTLFVRLQGDLDPNLAQMVISRYNHAFFIDRDFIAFDGLTFRNYGCESYAKAIYLRYASDTVIQNCTFAVNDIGIAIKGDSHRNVIQANTFYDTIFDWPWDAVKEGSNLETGGVVFYDPVEGRGNIVRRNTFHDYFDGMHVCPEATAGLTNETDVYENLVYRVGDDGMEADGQCSNVRIWKNTFHDVLMGISLAPACTGPVYAIGNLIHRTGMGNNNYTGSPFKFNSGYEMSGPLYLFHNTCDGVLPDNNGLYVMTPGSWSMIFSRNNIWAGTAFAIENYNASQPVDFDYDNLWRATSGSLVRWDDINYPTLDAFSAATGQEAHGLNSNPDFTNPAAGDYSLRPGSALIDAGVVIPGVNDTTFLGSGPDVGALESGGAPALNKDVTAAWLLLLSD